MFGRVFLFCLYLRVSLYGRPARQWTVDRWTGLDARSGHASDRGDPHLTCSRRLNLVGAYGTNQRAVHLTSMILGEKEMDLTSS